MKNIDIIDKVKNLPDDTNQEILQIKSDLKNIELTSTVVTRPDGSTVEESIVANETSISSANTEIVNLKTKTDTTNTNLSNLKTRVDNGQTHRVTEVNGFALNPPTNNVNDLIFCGIYSGGNMQNAPDSGWWYYEVLRHPHGNEIVQRATDLGGNRFLIRNGYINTGAWNPWRRL